MGLTVYIRTVLPLRASGPRDFFEVGTFPAKNEGREKTVQELGKADQIGDWNDSDSSQCERDDDPSATEGVLRKYLGRSCSS